MKGKQTYICVTKNKMLLNQIKNALGDPYFESEGSLLYNMDCVKGLAKLREHHIEINLTVTSPPYNIGKEYEEIKPVEEFVIWLSKINNLIFDITKPNGAYLLNVGYLSVENKGKAVPISYLLWDKSPFYLNQEIVWNYGAGVSSKRYLSPRNEKILWYVKSPELYTFNLDAIRDPDVKYPNQKKNGKLRCNTLGKNPSDVWQIAKVTTGGFRASEERTDHPAQFPADLVTRGILGFSNKNDLILDPFMGSGTTAEVCMRTDRLSLGFELRSDYCEIIKNRLLKVTTELQNRSVIMEIF